jgi:hypothetical protein
VGYTGSVHRGPSPSYPPWPALSFLALQILDHWGNRTTLRPAPRAEVLTAALALGEAAAPVAAAAWAERRSRYAAQLIRAHLGLGAEGTEPPGCDLVTAAAHTANLQVLRQAVGLATALLAGGRPGQEVTLDEGLTLRWDEGACCRLHPWPMVGSRLTVRAALEGEGWQRWRLLSQGAAR